VIPPAIFFYYSTLFDSRFKTLQQNQDTPLNIQSYCIKCYYIHSNCIHKKSQVLEKSSKDQVCASLPLPSTF
ncbi:hypothetical protein EWI20_15775, partial [Enterococcus faecium]